MVPHQPSPSRQSLQSLDALNVVLADVRDGLGPYLAIYLTTRQWDPSRIGLVMSVMGFASVAAQAPAGALIDRSIHKRGWIVAASILVALSSLAMVIYGAAPMSPARRRCCRPARTESPRAVRLSGVPR